MTIASSRARAIADVSDSTILATVEIAAPRSGSFAPMPHSGFSSGSATIVNSAGWKTSFGRLAELLADEPAAVGA